MNVLPASLTQLIEALGHLPGVGARTAERYAYYLLRGDKAATQRLSRSLDQLHAGIALCPKTFALIDSSQEVSPLYADSERNRQLIAIVEEPLDVVALERTGSFKGTYHVLGGVISPIDGIGPAELHIPELLDRLKDDLVTEVILATNAGVEGDSTALYVQRQIEEAAPEVTVTRLARGIPIGVDLEYADQITLSHALEGRRKL